MAAVTALLVAGTVILGVVFADQTFATVLEATRIRTAIGPSQEWYTENLRYYYLILPTVDGSLSRRFGFTDHRAEPVRLSVHHVAAQAGSRCGPRAGVAVDGHHLRHHVLPDVHPHQVGASLRPVRRRGCGDGRGGHGAGVTGRTPLGAQPDGLHLGGAVRDGAVLRDHQRLVVCVQLRRAVQQRQTRHRRNHGERHLLCPVRRHRAVGVLAASAAVGRGPVGAAVDRGAGTAGSRVHGRGVRRLDALRSGTPGRHLLQCVLEPARVRRRLRPGRRCAGGTRHQ